MTNTKTQTNKRAKAIQILAIVFVFLVVSPIQAGAATVWPVDSAPLESQADIPENLDPDLHKLLEESQAMEQGDEDEGQPQEDFKIVEPAPRGVKGLLSRVGSFFKNIFSGQPQAVYNTTNNNQKYIVNRNQYTLNNVKNETANNYITQTAPDYKFVGEDGAQVAFDRRSRTVRISAPAANQSQFVTLETKINQLEFSSQGLQEINQKYEYISTTLTSLNNKVAGLPAGSTGGSVTNISNPLVILQAGNNVFLEQTTGPNGATTYTVSADTHNVDPYLVPGAPGGHVDATSSPSLWVNKTGAAGDLLKLQVAGVDKFVVDYAGNVNISSTNLNGQLNLVQAINGQTMFAARRATDSAPAGDFITYYNAAGDTQLFRVDNSGNIYAGGISNSGALTITSTSTPQFNVEYNASNKNTTSVSSAGISTYAFNGTTPRAVFMPQSNRTDTFEFQNASGTPVATVNTTTPGINVAGNIQTGGVTRLDGSGNLANIGTITSGLINGQTISSSANFTGTVAVTTSVSTPSIITASGPLGITPAAGSNLNVNLSTTGDFAVNTNQLYVDTSAGNVGVGDTSPTNKLDVAGAIGISDTTVIDASRNLVNVGTISSGLINGQTISSAANFTGTVTVASTLSANNIVATAPLAANGVGRLTLVHNGASNGAIYSHGTDASTQGNLAFILRSSNGSLETVPLSLSSTGATLSVPLNFDTATGIVIDRTAATTNSVFARWGNTGGRLYWGVESSAGNSIISGAAAYSSFLSSGTSTPLEFGVNTSRVGGFSTAGSFDVGRNFTVTSAGAVSGITTLSMAGALTDTYTSDSRVSIGNSNSSNGTSAGADFIVTNDSGKTLQTVLWGSGNTQAALFGVARANNSFLASGIGSQLVVGTLGAEALTLGTNNAAAMTILSGGNVGIGTTTPATLLQVGARVGTTFHGTGVTTELNGADNNSAQLLIRSTSAFAIDTGSRIALAGRISATDDRIFGYIDGLKENGTSGDLAGYLQFRTQSAGGALTTAMRIASNGNVGIGATSPQQKLHVAISSGSGVMRFERTNATAGIFDLNISGLGVSTTDLLFDSQTNNTGFAFRPKDSGGNVLNALVIAASGNVGIGTTSPDYTFEVESGNVAFASYIKNTNASGFGLGIKTTGTTSSQYAFDVENGTASNSIFRVRNDGNVGIGTTSPGGLLHVSKSQTQETAIINTNINTGVGAYATVRNTNSNSTSGMVLFGTGYSPSGMIRADGGYIYSGSSAGGLTLNTEAAQPIYFGTNSTERMRIDSSGNVGIGPSGTLGYVGVRIHNNTTADANNVATMLGVTGGTMTASNNGQILSAISDIGSNVNTYATGTFTGLVAAELRLAGSNMAKTGTGTINNAATAYISSAPTIGTNNYSLLIDSGTVSLGAGNVGVGTTIPGAKLHASAVQDNSVLRKEILRLERSGGAAAVGGANRTTEIGFYDGDNTTYTASIGGMRDDPGSTYRSSLVFYTTGNGSNGFSPAITDLTEKMRINYAGNVGIDSTNPGGRLAINLDDTTVDRAINLSVTGAKTATNYGAVFSNSASNTTTDGINKTGLYIDSTGSFTGSTGTATNNYGLYIDTISGADNNYGAYISGNVGIGDATPNSIGANITTLDIDGATSTKGGGVRLQTSDDSQSAHYYLDTGVAYIGTGTNHGFQLQSNNTTRLTIASGGTISFTSAITDNNTGQYLCIDTTSFEVKRNNTACSASSQRFKDNIVDLNYGLNEVLGLRPVSFTFKPEMNFGTDPQLGFIAEEVEQLVPELVSYDSEGLVNSVNYPVMTSLLTKAVQELYEKINGLIQIRESEPTLKVIDNLEIATKLTVLGEAVFKGGIYVEGKLVAADIEAKSIVTEQLKVKNPDVSKNGLVIFDRITGQPTCIVSESGALKSYPGECTDLPPVVTESTPAIVETVSATPDGTTGSEETPFPTGQAETTTTTETITNPVEPTVEGEPTLESSTTTTTTETATWSDPVVPVVEPAPAEAPAEL